MFHLKGHILSGRKHPLKILFFCLLLILINTVLVSNSYGGYTAKLTKNIEYINVDLRDVFRDLAAIGQFSVLLDQNVAGNVSISFEKGIAFSDAVSIVAKTCGFYCKWFPDTQSAVISATKDIKLADQRNTEVFSLNTAWAASVAAALEVVIPRERIKPDIHNNTVEVTVNDLELKNVTEIIDRLDQGKQLMNAKIDVAAAPVEILKNIAIKYNPENQKMGAFILTAEQFKTISENTATNVLTSRNITMIDNEEEKLFVGDSIPRMYENIKGDRLNFAIEYIKIGTLLNLKIYSQADNRITVKVNEKVNIFKNSSKIGIDGPKVDSREIESTICLDADKSFLLLGALQRNEFMPMKDAPYTLPILSELFGIDSSKKNGLIILITPRSTGNVLPGTTGENQNEKPQTTPIPGNALHSPTITNTDQVSPTPTPDPAVLDIPTDEEKKEIKLGFSETQPGESASASNNTSFSDIGYTLKKGDTFAGIIKKFGASLQTVIERNRLQSSGEIRPGSSLIIPVPNDRIYIIKPKETLWRIAKRYGTTVEVLKDLNSITDIKKVQVYQKIVLPGLAKRIINPKF